MSKHDFDTATMEIKTQLTAQDWSITELLGFELAVLAVLNIYMTNDVCKGFGQDFNNGISIVSSRKTIAVIIDRKSSYFKDDTEICQYENLSEDIYEILIILQAAIDRVQQ